MLAVAAIRQDQKSSINIPLSSRITMETPATSNSAFNNKNNSSASVGTSTVVSVSSSFAAAAAGGGKSPSVPSDQVAPAVPWSRSDESANAATAFLPVSALSTSSHSYQPSSHYSTLRRNRAEAASRMINNSGDAISNNNTLRGSGSRVPVLNVAAIGAVSSSQLSSSNNNSPNISHSPVTSSTNLSVSPHSPPLPADAAATATIAASNSTTDLITNTLDSTHLASSSPQTMSRCASEEVPFAMSDEFPKRMKRDTPQSASAQGSRISRVASTDTNGPESLSGKTEGGAVGIDTASWSARGGGSGGGGGGNSSSGEDGPTIYRWRKHRTGVGAAGQPGKHQMQELDSNIRGTRSASLLRGSFTTPPFAGAPAPANATDNNNETSANIARIRSAHTLSHHQQRPQRQFAEYQSAPNSPPLDEPLAAAVPIDKIALPAHVSNRHSPAATLIHPTSLITAAAAAIASGVAIPGSAGTMASFGSLLNSANRELMGEFLEYHEDPQEQLKKLAFKLSMKYHCALYNYRDGEVDCSTDPEAVTIPYANVVGLQQTKRLLVQVVERSLDDKLVQQFGPPERVMFVECPPGHGIHTLLKAFCKMRRCNMVHVKTHVHAPGMIADILRYALMREPCVVFLDQWHDFFTAANYDRLGSELVSLRNAMPGLKDRTANVWVLISSTLPLSSMHKQLRAIVMMNAIREDHYFPEEVFFLLQSAWSKALLQLGVPPARANQLMSREYGKEVLERIMTTSKVDNPGTINTLVRYIFQNVLRRLDYSLLRRPENHDMIIPREEDINCVLDAVRVIAPGEMVDSRYVPQAVPQAQQQQYHHA